MSERPPTICSGLRPVLRDDTLPLLAQPIDTESNLLARSKVHWRLLAESNARRCSGQNEVFWLETHTPTQVTHEEGNAEHIVPVVPF